MHQAQANVRALDARIKPLLFRWKIVIFVRGVILSKETAGEEGERGKRKGKEEEKEKGEKKKEEKI